MIALITGASDGIGRSISIDVALKGYDVILVARNLDKLNGVKAEIEKKTSSKVTLIKCDLTNELDLENLKRETKNVDLDVLVNNAGLGDFGDFIDGDLNKFKYMIDLNITSLVELTHYFGDKMKQKGFGKIVNVASIASFQPGPYMAIYYASKSFVLSFSESLHEELKEYKVKVYCLCPGPTMTSFFKNSGCDEEVTAKGVAIKPQDVSKYLLKRWDKKQMIIVPGFKFRMMVFFERFLSRSALRRIMYRIQKRRGKK